MSWTSRLQESRDFAAAALLNDKGAAPQRDPQRLTHMKDTPDTSIKQHHFIREGVVSFSPSMASAVIENHSYAKNRDVSRSPKHVAVLAETMRRGTWLPKDQIAFARVRGVLTLINGHHRMHAQVAARAHIEWSITIYDCANDAELASLYARFDTNVKRRSDENILGAFGLADSERLTRTTARALWRAIPMIQNNMHSGSKSSDDNFFVRHIADDRHAVALAYAPEAREFEKCIANARGKVRQKLLTGSVTAVAMITLRSHLSTAYRFWEGVADNDGLRRGDPRATLFAYFLETEAKRGPNDLMFVASKAWNYYVKDKRLLQLKTSGNAVNISGTPYWVTP